MVSDQYAGGPASQDVEEAESNAVGVTVHGEEMEIQTPKEDERAMDTHGEKEAEADEEEELSTLEESEEWEYEPGGHEDEEALANDELLLASEGEEECIEDDTCCDSNEAETMAEADVLISLMAQAPVDMAMSVASLASTDAYVDALIDNQGLATQDELAVHSVVTVCITLC